MRKLIIILTLLFPSQILADDAINALDALNAIRAKHHRKPLEKDEELQKLAIQQNVFCIKDIQNPSQEIQKIAILNSNFNFFIKCFCSDLSNQWIEEQKLIRNILK